MTRATGWCWPLAVLVWLPNCAVLNAVEPPTVVAPPRLRRGLLFMVEGAGGFEAAVRSVIRTAAEAQLPIEVHRVRWTHGFCRVAADQMHSAHLLREGRKLADRILLCRHEAPDQPIFLMGHSAGCGVVLVAAESLPPNTVERIVLLAPAVSDKHDLRSALRSSCRGIDAFTSNRDWVCLGLGTLLFGTTDRYWMWGAAGKIGFKPMLGCPEDAALYGKLREYPWNPSLARMGHDGGHYGSYKAAFLRACVFPLLTPSLLKSSEE